MSTLGKKIFARGGLFAGLLALVGCDEAPTIVEGHSAGPIVASTINYVQAKGPILVKVHGSPYGNAGDAFADEVLKHIAGSVQAPVLRFTRNPAETGVSNFVYHIAFGAAEGDSGEELCKGESMNLSTSDSRITVLGAFCLDDQRLFNAFGSVKHVEQSDPFFPKLLVQLTQSVLDKS